MKDEAARIAAMLGALKANRIFIPLAPNSPEKWVAQVIEDSGAAQIIVDSSTRSIAELAATGSVTVMEVEQLARSSEPFVADRTASPDDTAYIVYTSGSTGRPKGVANSHRSLIRYERCSKPGFRAWAQRPVCKFALKWRLLLDPQQLLAVTFGGMPVSV